MFDPSKKKKKKKVVKDVTDDSGLNPSSAISGDSNVASTAGSASSVAGFVDDDNELSYDDMLAKVYSLLLKNNPELTDRTKLRLKAPQVMKVGTTRIAWENFKEICAGMKRSIEHVQSFFLAELGTTGSVDGSNRLIIKGKYQASNLYFHPPR
jgi:translation initiation factor 2 subunit 2